MILPRHSSLIPLLALLVLHLPAFGGDGRPGEGEREAYRWFSVPVEVSRGSANARFLPVRARIDFSDLLKQLGAEGVVDTRALRFYRLGGDGAHEIAVQFTAEPQPRIPNAPRLLDTPPGVSYLAEYAAGVTPAGTKVAGDVAWIAETEGNGSARYRLEFGVRKDGIVVQVPYPPQDLKVFDAEGNATPLRHVPRMQITPDRPFNGQVHLSDGGQAVTTYHLGPEQPPKAAGDVLPFRRPFFYPVLGPGGVPLTDFGKPHDPTASHAHHYSLWVAHNNVGGTDFWGERGGVIVSAGLPRSESGPVFCELVHDTRWTDGSRDLLRERRRMVLYHTPEAFRAIDVELEFSPAGGKEVVLGKTTFGFLAARVAQSMTVFDGGGEIRNARGDLNERGAHLKRAEWIDQSGPVVPDGGWMGVTLMDHPTNPNHPTTWHCRNDGWACASFTADAQYTLRPDQPLRLRYRIVLHRGNAADGEVAKRYAEYASSPAVDVGKPAALAEK